MSALVGGRAGDVPCQCGAAASALAPPDGEVVSPPRGGGRSVPVGVRAVAVWVQPVYPYSPGRLAEVTAGLERWAPLLRTCASLYPAEFADAGVVCGSGAPDRESMSRAASWLCGQIERGGLFPLEDYLLQELDEDEGAPDQFEPRALLFIPADCAFGYDAEDRLFSYDGRVSAAEMFLFCLLAWSGEGMRDLLAQQTIAIAQELVALVLEAVDLVDRREDVEALLSDEAGLFAGAGQPLADIPLAARYLRGATGNLFLDTARAESGWPWGEAPLPWSVANVRRLQAEWAAAAPLWDRITGTLAALHRPDVLAHLLLAVVGTVAEARRKQAPAASADPAEAARLAGLAARVTALLPVSDAPGGPTVRGQAHPGKAGAQARGGERLGHLCTKSDSDKESMTDDDTMAI